MHTYGLVRKYMDVNEHGRLSNFTLGLAKEQHYCCSIFHSSAFNNEHNSNATLSVKSMVPSLQLSSTLYFGRQTLHLGIFVVLMLFVVRIVFPRCDIINKKTKSGWSIKSHKYCHHCADIALHDLFTWKISRLFFV